jgi:hypothetical protein
MPENREALSQKVDRVKKLIEKFPAAASTLNDATDQLSKSVGKLDAVLKRFSLGVPTWVSFNRQSDADAELYYEEQVGYAKIGGKWGVAIKTVEYNSARRDSDREQWLFNDAPRLLRVNAVEKVPELLEAILGSAADMSKRITEKAEEVDVLTAAMNAAAESPAPPKTETAFRAKLYDALADVKITQGSVGEVGPPRKGALGITGVKAGK